MQCSQKLHGFSPVYMHIDFPIPSVISQSFGIHCFKKSMAGPDGQKSVTGKLGALWHEWVGRQG